MLRFDKKYIIIFLVIFVLVSLSVLISDSNMGRVRFRNQSFQIHQEDARITNRDVEIDINKTKIFHKDVKSDNAQINVENKDISITPTKASSNSSAPALVPEFRNTDIAFSNVGGSEGTEARLNNIANAIKNKKLDDIQRETARSKSYRYSNVSWNIWRSNFVNRFLDDSIYIKSLDDYGIGTWFYYSFIVTKDGDIEDIKVKSIYLDEEDKVKIRNLIRSYAHQEITIFPTGSKKERAKVSAIVLLGDTETKTKPSDFHDFERIKIEN